MADEQKDWNCGNCAYWYPTPGVFRKTKGVCKSSPPQISRDRLFSYTEWPTTDASDFCHEHEFEDDETVKPEKKGF